MVRLGGAASPNYLVVFPAIKEWFQRRGIDLDWILYSGWDALVDGFVSGEVDLAWNGPLSYVKIRRRLTEPCRVIAMRDVDVGCVTHFITGAGSDITELDRLKGRRFAFGSRGSVEAGVLPYHYLKHEGIAPRTDLSAATFYEERPEPLQGDERDVIKRVAAGEYGAGAVSASTLEALSRDQAWSSSGVRVLWSSPPYSHCCFTAQGDMEPALSDRIEEAFLSISANDPLGKRVLEGEECNAFVPGITEGWDTLEVAAEEEGLI